MKSYPTLKRWALASSTLAVFAAVLAIVAWNGRDRHGGDEARADAAASGPRAWPLYGGSVQRNMVNTFEHNVPIDWGNQKGKLNVKWVADLGSRAYGGPVVAGGKVYIGTNNESPRNDRDRDPMTKQPIDKGVMMCFRESDGEFLWQAVHDKLPGGLVNDWPKEGICSSPFVDGNRLYYVSNRCEVICADTEGLLDGKGGGKQDPKYSDKTDARIIWRLDMMKELGVFPHNLATCSPLVVGDTLFLVTSNGVDEGHINIPKPEAPSFLALKKTTGEVLWSNNLPSINLVKASKKGKDVKDLIKGLVDRGQLLMHGQWSNPVYAEPNGKAMIIFPGGDGWLRTFEPGTGKLIWEFDCNPPDSRYELGGKGTRNDFIATPVVYENKVYIGVGQDPEHDEGVGHLWCIDITKVGDVSPQLVTDDSVLPVKTAPNKNSALVWHIGGPAAADADRDYIFGRTLSTCAIHDGLVYAAEVAGYLHCIDAQTGEEYWVHDMRSKTWSSPYWVDGKVYLGNEKGKVLIFKHGKKKELLKEVDMKNRIRASPVVVNGTLYIIAENKLFAIGK